LKYKIVEIEIRSEKIEKRRWNKENRCWSL